MMEPGEFYHGPFLATNSLSFFVRIFLQRLQGLLLMFTHWSEQTCKYVLFTQENIIWPDSDRFTL